MSTGSSTGSTTRRTSRRPPGKLALLRAKLATVVLAVGLFLATLTGIAVYNPQVAQEAAAPAPTQQIIVVAPGGPKPLLPPPAHVSSVRPFARSRGS